MPNIICEYELNLYVKGWALGEGDDVIVVVEFNYESGRQSTNIYRPDEEDMIEIIDMSLLVDGKKEECPEWLVKKFVNNRDLYNEILQEVQDSEDQS